MRRKTAEVQGIFTLYCFNVDSFLSFCVSQINVSLIGMHFVWPIALICGQKGWQIWQRFCAPIYRMSFWSFALDLSALCLSLTLNVAVTLFNGKKFTLPLASRKVCPDKHMLLFLLSLLLCLFCWTFVQIQALFLLFVLDPVLNISNKSQTNSWQLQRQQQ